MATLKARQQTVTLTAQALSETNAAMMVQTHETDDAKLLIHGITPCDPVDTPAENLWMDGFPPPLALPAPFPTLQPLLTPVQS